MPFAVRFLKPNEVCAHLLCVLWTFISLDGFIAYFLLLGVDIAYRKKVPFHRLPKVWPAFAMECSRTINLLCERSFWSVLSHCMLAGSGAYYDFKNYL